MRIGADDQTCIAFAGVADLECHADGFEAVVSDRVVRAESRKARNNVEAFEGDLLIVHTKIQIKTVICQPMSGDLERAHAY